MTNMRSVNLRPVEYSDLTFLCDLANDPGVRENVVGWDWPVSAAGQQKWFESTLADSSTKRLIVESDKGEAIGLTGFWEIDWRNRTAMTAIKLGGTKGARGNGYGVLAIREIMRFGFLEAGFNRLHATVLASNPRSLAAYVGKSGWTEEGRMRQHIWRDGNYVDLVQIGILRSEYLQGVGRND